MPAARSRQSAPPSSSYHTRRPSDRYRAASVRLARVFENDGDDENDEAAASPYRTGRITLPSSALTKSHHRRTKSHTHTDLATRDPIHLTPVAKRKLALRPSLAGPRVQEMTVVERARVLGLIAQDCIVKLLAVGLNGWVSDHGHEPAWHSTWDSLQAQRHQSLFVDHNLPFTDILDVTQSLHKRLRGRIDASSLERANHLCNLATFIYIIIDPDRAAGMLSRDSDAATSEVVGRSGGSRKGKDRDTTLEDIQEHTRDRNRILMMAWKHYWSVVVPRNMRTNIRAMGLWLDFATQICLTFTSDTIGDNATQDLPAPSEEVLTTLFAASAIIRRGQWRDTQGPDVPDAEIVEMEVVEQKWARMASRRRKELNETRDDVLARRYLWHEFQSALLRFLDDEILHTLIDRSVSPKKPVIDPSESTTTSDTDSGAQGSQSPETEALGIEDLATPDEEKPDISVDNLIDFDQFQSVLEDMQRTDTPMAELDNQENRPPAPMLDTPTQPQTRARPGGFRFGQPQADAKRLQWESQEQTATTSPSRPTRQPLFQPLGSDSDEPAGPSRPRSVNGPDPNHLERHQLTVIAAPASQSTEAAPPLVLDDSDDDLLPGSSVLGSAAHTPVAKRTAVLPDDDDDDDDLPASSVLGIPYRRRNGTGTPTMRRSASAVPSAQLDTTPRQQAVDGSPITGTLAAPSFSSPAPSPRLRPAAELLGPSPSAAIDRTTPTAMATSSSHQPPKQANDNIDWMDVDKTPTQLPAIAHPTSQLKYQETPSGADASAKAPGPMNEIVRQEHERMPTPDIAIGDTADLLGVVANEPTQAGETETVGETENAPENTAATGPPVGANEPIQADGTVNVGETGDIPEVTAVTRSPAVGVASASHTSRPQRAFVNHRQRRYEHPEFAGRDPDETDSDSDLDNPIELPPIRMPSKTPVPRSPLADISPNKLMRSPHTPYVRDELDEFIVVPPFEPLPAELRFRSRLHETPALGIVPEDTTMEENDPAPPLDAHSETLPDPDDLYLIDDDGSPLETDPEFTIPPKYEFPPSRLHGQKADQTSTYSRKAGTRRWTQEEALLLYRTVQKVPLDQLYPLRVVWYLYGEHGIVSHDLEDFNPQHMKDKMKTIVQTRVNNRRPVVGRARFWLPPIERGREHPDKVALKAEIDAADKSAKQQFRELLMSVDAETSRPAGKRKSPEKRRRKRTTRSGKRDSSPEVDDDVDSARAEDGEGDDEEGDVDRESSLGMQEGEEEMSDTTAPPPPKRRRGRTRKNPVAQPQHTAPPKRGPGRPRKNGPAPTTSPSQKKTSRAVSAGTSTTKSPSARDTRAPQRSEKASTSKAKAKRSQRQVFVDLSATRKQPKPTTRTRSVAAMDEANGNSVGSETDQDGNLVESLVAGIVEQEQQDSDAETVYDDALTGKQMRRSSAGERLLSPPYMTASSDEGEDDDDGRDEDVPGEISTENRAADEGDQTNDEDEQDDDYDPNARIAHEFEIRQRVLGGYDDETLPHNLRRR